MTPDDLIASAQRIGADPLDYATVMQFESGMDPSRWGGSGGRHVGLIQFGPDEQAKYGANDRQSATEQLGAVERYLTDRGFKPGMGMMDLYSTINAGSPGRYNASDTANGGTPGSVADKVTSQMGPHRERAAAFLGGSYTPPSRSPSGGPALAGFGVLPTPAAPPETGLSSDDQKMIAGLVNGQDPTQPVPEGLLPRRTMAPQSSPFDASRFAGILSRKVSPNGRRTLV